MHCFSFCRRRRKSMLKKIYDECPICLDHDDRQHFLQPCGHTVHTECLLEWIVASSSCSRPMSCLMCKRPIDSLLMDDERVSFETWKKNALLQRWKERFMSGCFLYIFYRQKTYRFYITPSFSTREWKRKVTGCMQTLRTWNVLWSSSWWREDMDWVEGRRYSLWGGDVAVMFSKSTCVMT